MIALALHPEKITNIDSVTIRGLESKNKFLEKSAETIKKIEKEIAFLQSNLDKLNKLKDRVNKYNPEKSGN